jgi:4-amino-4-deoxy-L-arabinose transferase-like glycosyltransferase
MHPLLKKITKRQEIIVILVILAVTLTLRLINLGYSDYMSDEPGTFFYRGYRADTHLSRWDFLLKQKKGPMQVFVGYIPYVIVGNYGNEFAQRLPFALFGGFSMVLFYKTVHKLTKDQLVSLVATLLLSTNGLIVAYSRIAQYQNLILFFSFATLYFFADLLEEGKNHLRSTLIGSFCWSIAVLSHWDAAYILIPVIPILVQFLLSKKYSLKYKMRIVIFNVLLLLLLLMPFMLPYLKYLGTSEDNLGYLDSIVGAGRLVNELPEVEIRQFLLYNPFVTGWFYLITAAIGLTKPRTWRFSSWFVIITAVFWLLMKYPGLHFFNIFIPWVVVCALGLRKIVDLLKLLPGRLKLLSFIPTLAVYILLAFFWYQSYLLFVDHKIEYPTQSEKILWFEAPAQTTEKRLRHKTGFPHKRYWHQINEFINAQNLERGGKFRLYHKRK